MARPLRIEYEGAVYHVISRGNRGEYIFEEGTDKEVFIEILQKAVERYKIDVYAYSVMSNHYHLLIEPPHGALTKVMHYIGSSYGSYLRRTKGWTGHLFGGRYKSLCVDRESYLLELSRYIHLNPVKAGIVKRPEEYRWSSYGHYIGKKGKTDWVNREWLLQEYGKTYRRAQSKYKQYIEAGRKDPPKYPDEEIVGQALLGSEKFIHKVVKKLKTDKAIGEVTAKRVFTGKVTLEEIYRAVCNYYGVKQPGKGGDKEKRAWEMLIYLAKTETAALNKEIAGLAGNISPSAVSHAYRRQSGIIEGNRIHRNKWDQEVNHITSRFKG